jgi:preprotein translocase subunit SecD
MTDTDTLEQRLRRTFEAVAAQPVSPASTVSGAGTVTDAWWERRAPARAHRNMRRTVGAVSAAAVVAVVALLVAYGPRSSDTSPGAVSAGAPGHTGAPGNSVHAVFAPTAPTTHAVVEQIESVIFRRLRAFGDKGASVRTGVGGTIQVTAQNLTPAEIHLMGTTDNLYIRPVLCGAVSVRPPDVIGLLSGPLPSCQAQYATTAANLGVDVRTGVPDDMVRPDPGFASYPSTSERADDPSATVLLSGDPSAGAREYPRFVLGPAQLSGSAIAAAHAQSLGKDSGSDVLITLKRSAATQWDAVARQNFHQYLAFDLNGLVLSAPLVQPLSSTFEPFGGTMQISGHFSAAEAKDLAAVVGSGSLPVGLILRSLTTVSGALGAARTP